MKYTNFIKCLLASIPLLSFWGCESEDLPNSGQGELVPVTIRLTTSAPDDVQTRANTAGLVEDDYKISSLNVYITDGSSMTTLTESDFTFTEPESKETVRTATVELVKGKTYTVYALANTTPDINYQTNSPVDAIAMINSTTNPNTVPMSAQTTWRIDGDIEIELVRMVAQMRVSIVQDDNNSGTNARTFTISDFKITNLLPATTNLYRERYGYVELPTSVTRNDWTWSNPNIGKENGTAFYLHETEGTFTVSLNDGTRIRSNTFSTEIPRNYILPLIIHLSDYRLDFTGSTYQHGPIGVIKNPIPINNYTIALPSGASAVTIKIGLKEAGGTVDKTINWDYNIAQDGDLPALGVIPSTDNGILTVLNNYNFPAGLTGTITLNLSTTVNDGGTNKDLKFTVTINVKKIEEVDTRSASNEAEPIIVEL